ncbi:MAG: ester cyclase [Rhodospirillaceae bacterium]|nr:ester cyclase [Rhodospirillaceae bacterium]
MKTGLVTLVAAMMLSASAFATDTYCKGNEKNLATYLKMHDVLFMQRDETRAGEFYAAEFISHNADEGGSATVKMKPDALKPMWIDSKKNMPDRVLTNDLIVCADDFVIVRVTVTGTQTGPFFGMPAPNKKINMTAIDIYKFKDGKVVERWGNNDGITMLGQLGLLSAYAQMHDAQAAKKAEQK